MRHAQALPFMTAALGLMDLCEDFKDRREVRLCNLIDSFLPGSDRSSHKCLHVVCTRVGYFLTSRLPQYAWPDGPPRRLQESKRFPFKLM